jgi:hypothetical protein
MKQKALYIGLGLLIVLLAAALVYAWFFKGDKVPVGQYAEAKPEKEVKDIPKQEIVIKHVHVYDKGKVSKALNLPKEITDNPAKQVIADAEIKSSERAQSAVTVIDTESGESTVLTKEKAYSWLEFRNVKEVGIRAGYGFDGVQGDIFARWHFMRVKGVNLSVYGEATGAVQSRNIKAKAMLETSYRW